MMMKKIFKFNIMKFIIPILLAFLVGSIILLISNINPISAFYNLFIGAFGSGRAFLSTLYYATPLILTGTATAIAFKANLFYMGVEGALYIGGFCSSLAGIYFHGLPPYIHIPIALLIGMITGGLFAMIPGILKGILDVNEMVTSIMLNYVAILGTTYLASFPFKAKDAGFSATEMVEKSAVIPKIFDSSMVHYGLFLSLIFAILIYIMFKKSTFGYDIESMGKNVSFSESCGMQTAKKTIYIITLSGALGGLAGAMEVLGTYKRFIAGFSSGLGWDGLTISLLSNNNPIGVIFSSIFFGGLYSGGAQMELLADVPRTIISVIQGLIIFFLAVDFTVKRFKKIKSR